MLDDHLRQQLRGALANMRVDVDLIAHLDDSPASAEITALLKDLQAASPHLRLVEATADEAAFNGARTPGFTLRRAGTAHQVAFAGLPMGHEFTSLVLALLHMGGHPPRIEAEQVERIQALGGDYRFETFYSQSCQLCPDVVQALNSFAALNPAFRPVAIDGALFREEVEARQVMAVPAVFLNGEPFAQGRLTVEDILAKLDQGATARTGERLKTLAPFDVLVVGGGPAGAAAALYAARKGIRTGLVADRMGGQLLDTMGIENFVSVPHTEGPRLARDLEAHVRAYDVDIIAGQQADGLDPAGADGFARLRLAGGIALKAKTLILATGARWRQLGVPGEAEYRNRGVAYCPHCDGPLFKGKRVAVIGGGNSGVEAAIDLAGIVAHVTLIEYDDRLRADAVLQRKLGTLSNITVHTSAQTLKVEGNGDRVTGLVWRDRSSGDDQTIALDGVFVQIGLVPNTEWLKETLALSPRGEIEVDARGATSLPGVFAAGDGTTTPYKQIIIAAGEGAKAALSAFDHLIRSDPTG